jgi:hypothetical protein
MAAFNKFYPFVEALAEKVHNLGSDTLKVMLVDSPAPANTNSVKTDLTEISAGNGYTAGGPTVTITSSAQTAGTYKLVGTDITVTASGGSIGPFRYAVMYNDTAASKNLIGWWDYGSTITLASGDSLTIDFDASNGILTLA